MTPHVLLTASGAPVTVAAHGFEALVAKHPEYSSAGSRSPGYSSAGSSGGRPDPLVAADAVVLVVVQEADPLHPSQLGYELIGLLSRCRLVVFDRPRMVLRQRARP